LKEEEEGKGISEKKSLLPEKEQIISASTPDVSALEIKDEIEVQELKSEEENISVSPTSAEEIEELRKVYREINLEAEKIPSSQRKKGAIYTATIAELYVKQNNISRALEIYNAMPEEERSKKLPRIQELQSKLQDIQSENSSKQNNFRTENGK
jgi:thioredoxin-like negative regulator of GroEL